MENKKINFKQPKYIIPLILLPLILIVGFQASSYLSSSNDEENSPKSQELSLSLGESQDSILSKNAAYDELFLKGDDRTMLEGLDKEDDSLMKYSDNLDYRQKRYVDSLKAVRNMRGSSTGSMRKSYYEERNDEKDYQRSADMIRMLNNESSGNSGSSGRNQSQSSSNYSTFENDKKPETDPVKMLKQQMLLMDSIEKSKDPEYQANLAAEIKLRKNKEKMAAFLNSTLRVNKSSLNPSFNSISKKKENNFIKAVIDENLKGYLGSRIRFRLLEDITVGKHKINKGTLLYGQISGFSLQRVNLNVISILNNGEILPINLSVFDMDGMQGLYVPQSDFREMLREMGSNSVQGTQMDNGGESFFTSLFSSLFSSTSRTISNMIRQNKAKLKYNSYIFLINEKELNKNENN